MLETTVIARRGLSGGTGSPSLLRKIARPVVGLRMTEGKPDT